MKYAAQMRVDGQIVNLNISGPDMETALRRLKKANPHASGFTVWNPDHVPPFKDK